MKYRIIDNNKNRYLLFLHCICGNNKIFDKQIKKLNKHYNFVLVDFPSHGESIECDDKFSFESISLEIIDILNKEGIQKVDVISLSLGAMILDVLIRLAPKGLINNIVFTSTLIGFPFEFINQIFYFFVKHIKFFPRRLYMLFITFTMLPLIKNRKQRKKFYSNSLKMPKTHLYRYFEIMSGYIKECSNKDFGYIKNYCNKYIFISGKIDLFTIFLIKNSNKLENLIILPKSSHLCNLDEESGYDDIILNFLKVNEFN